MGAGYEAFWLRDYAYMLEGNPDAFTDREVIDACLLFAGALATDGAGVDCIKFDGTRIYKPGFGTMGENPVADGSQFTIDVAWRTYQKTHDIDCVKSTLDSLVRTFRAIPRNSETGLVYIDPKREYDRCPYGFTDTILKQGDVLFCSLLMIRACRQLADLHVAAGLGEASSQWNAEAERIVKQVRAVFWDEKIGLFRAATVQCKEPDIWGSAFAVFLNVATEKQARAIARYFQTHYGEIVQRGQVRHIPGGTYWEAGRERDVYQNGAYWATPTGWFVYALDLVDPKLADQTIIDLVEDFRERGVMEWVIGSTTRLDKYNASASLPLAGIRAMQERRAAR